MSVEQILTYLALGGIFLVAVSAGFFFIRYFKPLGDFIKTGVESKKYTLIWNLAQEAYNHTEKWAKSIEEAGSDKVLGSAKAAEAYDYFAKHMGDWGVTITSVQIKAIIQSAWNLLEKMPKEQGSKAVVNTQLVGTDHVMKEVKDMITQEAYKNNKPSS